MATSRLLEPFRISGAMSPCVLRVKLRGSDFDFGATPERAAAYTRWMGEMRRILVKGLRVPAITADRVILKTLEAAIDFQLAGPRYRCLKAVEARSLATLDRLLEIYGSFPVGLHNCHQPPKDN